MYKATKNVANSKRYIFYKKLQKWENIVTYHAYIPQICSQNSNYLRYIGSFNPFYRMEMLMYVCMYTRLTFPDVKHCLQLKISDFLTSPMSC